jgi:predicted HicB family RNase H-like nuclease
MKEKIPLRPFLHHQSRGGTGRKCDKPVSGKFNERINRSFFSERYHDVTATRGCHNGGVAPKSVFK